MPFKDDKGEVVDDTDSRVITACRMIAVLRKVRHALLSGLLSDPLVRFSFLLSCSVLAVLLELPLGSILRWAMRRWLTEPLQELLSEGTALKPLHLVLSLVRPSSVLLLESIADEPGITVEWVLTNELEGGGGFPSSLVCSCKDQPRRERGQNRHHLA